MNAPMLLSPESLAKIDQAVAKYPSNQKQSAVMAALTIAQDEKGWLSTETMDFVAHYLGMPLDLFQRIMIGTASVTVLRLGHGQPSLVKLNETGPLTTR